MKFLQREYLFLACLLFLLPAASVRADSDGPELSRQVMTIWTDREGLPSDTVLDVIQDRDGYVWLASYDGLVRFDGQTFRVLNAEDDGFDGKSARVFELGPDGTLWIGTNTAGLYRYRDGKFARFGIEEGLPDLSIRSLAIDAEGVVWVGTVNGVSRSNGSRFEPAVPRGSASFGIANFLLPLADGSVVVGSNLPGLWLITAKGVEPFLAQRSESKQSFSAAFLDRSNGQLWLGTSSGQILRVRNNEIVEAFSPEFLVGSSVNAFYSDAGGTLWVATDRGILSRKGNGFEAFSASNGLPSNTVSSLCRDAEGNLWAGTERGGLVKFSQGKFVNVSKDDGLISDGVNAVTEDSRKSVWVATDEGISFFPSASDSYATDAARRRSVDGVVALLSGVRVRQIRAESDGSLWFATYSDNGLFILRADGTTESINQKSGLPTNRVRFSFRTSKGALWIGTTAGPVLLDDGAMKVFAADSGLPNLFILCVMEDPSGSIWLGTDGGGVSVYDGTSFRTMTRKDGLAGNVVFRIFRDLDNRLWLCTSEGLSLYVNGAFLSADRAIGVGGQSVYEAIEDKSSRLWIITSRKVILASASDLASSVGTGKALSGCRVYDRLDGLAGQLSANAWSFMNANGIVYLPTLKGLSIYNPQSVSVNLLPPPVRIEKVEIDGRVPDLSSSPVRIDAHSRRVTFYYTALSFVIPQRVQFRYKLEGFDRDWIDAGVNRQIGYTNLRPGTYTFRVKAGNNDGVVNETGASVTLYQQPLFWQTIPFYVVIALFFVLTGFLSAWIRVRTLARRAKALDRLVTERTGELAAEKEKSDSLLRNLLPPSVAEELKNTGRATPHVYEHSAVLFADIVGFTPWSETLGPEEIIHELNEVFTGFDGILERRGCERIKTLGDGYLACSGLPLPVPDYALRLVRAAVDMFAFLEERNKNAKTKIEIRVGIDAGSIVGGVVGVKKYIFDVFGDTVNTAFRLESLSVPMGLTVSQGVAALLGGEFSLVERPERVVKGKGSLTSYYVRYREIPSPAVDNASAVAVAQKVRLLLDAGSLEECCLLLESLDYTTLEPEAGFELFELASRVWLGAGNPDRSRECALRAERFRM